MSNPDKQYFQLKQGIVSRKTQSYAADKSKRVDFSSPSNDGPGPGSYKVDFSSFVPSGGTSPKSQKHTLPRHRTKSTLMSNAGLRLTSVPSIPSK